MRNVLVAQVRNISVVMVLLKVGWSQKSGGIQGASGKSHTH
jgi:hypothetical protein